MYNTTVETEAVTFLVNYIGTCRISLLYADIVVYIHDVVQYLSPIPGDSVV